MECMDYMWTNGPRLFSAAVHLENNRDGRQDAIFHKHVLNFNPDEDISKEVEKIGR